jgi:uncharacterized protein (UPF0333 family)
MQTKKESFWFMFRMLLLMNVVLVTVIALAHPNTKNSAQKQESCSSTKKVSADVLNSVTVKLM